MLNNYQKQIKAIALFALACIAAFGLISCSQPLESKTSNQTSTEIAIPEICNIFSNEEIKNILGKDFEPMSLELITEDTKGCKYVANAENEEELIDSKTLNFIIRTANSENDNKNAYYQGVNVWVNSQFENRETSYVEDLGTEAFWAYTKKSPQLLVYQDTKLLIITFGNFNLENQAMLEVAKPIAQMLLDRV